MVTIYSAYTRRLTISVLAAIVVLVCGGCEKSEEFPPTLRNPFHLASPARGPDGVLGRQFRCGSGAWLPLSWGDIPQGTAQLALYIGSYGAARQVAGGWRWRPINAAALIVGIPPRPERLPLGRLPRGAVELSGLPRGGLPGAKTSLPICPGDRALHRFVFRLYALGKQDEVVPATLGHVTAYIVLLHVVHSALSTVRLTARGR
jgi:phosphatidylethanolamine-binding protein (PEBP) family uncharacterized protein